MADKPQSFKNHTRLDPLFHQFLGPLSFILLIAAVTSFVRNVGLMTAFQVVAAIWAVVVTFKIRLYALKVQDRIIRLEERLRMHELFSEPLKSRIGEFTESQPSLCGLHRMPSSRPLRKKLSRGSTKSRSKLRSKLGVPTISGSSRIFLCAEQPKAAERYRSCIGGHPAPAVMRLAQTPVQPKYPSE